MPYNDENVQVALINTSQQAIQPIIPHPGVGKRLAIDKIVINPSGGANITTLTGAIAVPFGLNDNQNLDISNDIHNRLGIFPCNADQALSLTLGSNTQVEGFVLYRIING